MLERVAVHQTRLRTPGIGLDAKGVALGAKGLVLLPSLDRLIAFVALYTRSASLEDMLRTLAIDVVKSKLGMREVAVSFSAESADRMDRVAEVARLAGGFTFTGTSRHFVQYRDAAAPFGYDATDLEASDASLALYHNAFRQTYDKERTIGLDALLLQLEPHIDPQAGAEPGPRFIVAEQGVGTALIQYFVRSNVEADVGLAEWPPESSFDDEPVRRYLFRLPSIPDRMVPLLGRTPGLSLFVPQSEGAAVEVGFRHPVNLRACPVFPPKALILFRGGRQGPLRIEATPVMGDVRAFASMELAEGPPVLRGEPAEPPGKVAVPLRLLPSTEPWRSVTATYVAKEEFSLLRRLAYALGARTLRQVEVAFVDEGAYLRHPEGIESIPVGEFFRQVYPALYVPAGFDVVPAVAPEVLYRCLGTPSGHVLFIDRKGRARGVSGDRFAPFEDALLEAQEWAPMAAKEIEPALTASVPKVMLPAVGLLPMRDVARIPVGDEDVDG